MHSHRPALRTVDRLAWITFKLGVIGIFWVTLRAMLSESDGDFRTWSRIRQDVWLFWCVAMLTAVGPIAATVMGIRERLRDNFDHRVDGYSREDTSRSFDRT